MNADLIARRLRDLAPAAESGRRPACAQAMREAADALEAMQAEMDYEVECDVVIPTPPRTSVTYVPKAALEAERSLADQLAEAMREVVEEIIPDWIDEVLSDALAAYRAARGEP